MELLAAVADTSLKQLQQQTHHNTGTAYSNNSNIQHLYSSCVYVCVLVSLRARFLCMCLCLNASFNLEETFYFRGVTCTYTYMYIHVNLYVYQQVRTEQRKLAVSGKPPEEVMQHVAMFDTTLKCETLVGRSAHHYYTQVPCFVKPHNNLYTQ